MDLETADNIKRLVIASVVSDDTLFQKLVLKGGNALDIAHCVSARASLDVDFSMESDFPDDDLPKIKLIFERNLNRTFHQAGYQVLDVKLEARPETLSASMKDFWRGYQVTFKLVSVDRVNSLQSVHARRSKSSQKRDSEDNSTLFQNALRKAAMPLGKGNTTSFRIDISAHEFCGEKVRKTIGGYSVLVYPMEVIALEKLRAICQQLPAYLEIVKSNPVPRARDFFDIYLISQHVSPLVTYERAEIGKKVFEAKRVPLELINAIDSEATYQFHMQSFPAVQNTVRAGVRLEKFQFYFNHTLSVANELKTFWDV